MQCPYCQTENREDRERCYACDKDISMLRLLVNKARHHYNDALEHAERGRTTEAIDELRNALDLDRRFTNAHVVLGTLYAKESEYDKARECWDNALNLSPELSKAHNYLQRVQAVENTLPALKSYRWLAVILLIMVIGLGVALAFMVRPDPSVRRLGTARELYQQQKYGKALKELDSVRRSSDRGSATNIAADALRLALKADLNQQIRYIQELKFNNRYAEALSAITALEASQPDTETSSKLALLRPDIAHYYLQDIKALYLDFESSATDYAHLKEEIDKFLEVSPEIPEKAYISDYLTQAAELQIDRMRQDFAQSHRYFDVRHRLSELMSTFPEPEKLRPGRTDLIDEILSWMFEEFHRLVASGEFVQAEQLLNHIDDSIEDFRDVVDVSGPAELARRVLADSRKKAQILEVGELIKQRQFEDADLALFYLVETMEFSPVETEVLESYENQIANHRIDQSRDRERQKLDRWLKLQISADEASATLASLEARLSAASEPFERSVFLVQAAASAAKLSKKDVLTSITATLQEEQVDADLIEQVGKLAVSHGATTGSEKLKRPASGRKAPNAIQIESVETPVPERTPTREEMPRPSPARRSRQ